MKRGKSYNTDLLFFPSCYYIDLMGKIKSALEIAMEKTENIAVDENKIRASLEEDKIKRIAGEYMGKEEKDDSILEKLDDYSKESQKSALKSLIMSSASLPTYEAADDRFDRFTSLFSHIMDSDPEKVSFYSQIIGFVKQYPVHRKQLLEQLEAQLQPMLDQKSEEMSRQLGRTVHLTVEDDKETLEIIEKNLERLDKQYNDNLSQARAELESFF